MSLDLHWIDPEEYSFNSCLLLERFQIRLLLQAGGWGADDRERWDECMGIALSANPAVKWYLSHRCPECAPLVEHLAEQAPRDVDAARIREAERVILLSVEDFVIYTTPEQMESHCDFIHGWDKEHLLGMTDFSGKVVLDVGAGSGRLTFAAAERAGWVYASEPVGTLREFLRDRIRREGIHNVRVSDGFAAALPFPDDLFDVVMSGHVVGDDYEGELAEMTRVCRPGGWLLDCPGDSKRDIRANPELRRRGWEEIHYVGQYGKDVYLYRKQVEK